MALLRKLLLTAPIGLLLLAVYIVYRLLNAFMGINPKNFTETIVNDSGTIHKSFSIGNPIIIVLFLALLLFWLWSLTSLLYKYLNKPVARLRRYKIMLLLVLLLASIGSVTGYFFAEQIFHNDLLLKIFLISMVMVWGLYLISVGYCFENIYQALNKKRSFFLWHIFKLMLFPISLWRHQREIKNIYLHQSEFQQVQ